ncbi:DUF3488 and transglutaminase-like domain-containing protein [Malikia sp.]|uniref:transglutaminase family protein n=1 Tax=Malikia sp. TaxID=2070706 RepID=UPI002621569C|nr:DUF3488 and transglutaminase-like domain-containing protein [Malikia sp.]MDD2729901.1 DUF3488 and transglutaminase-like domain-containing protein [Malikia sp.]
MLNARSLATLPRETRDTLFLLAVIAWVLLMQAGHLPLWCTALALTMLLGRGWLALTQRALPPLAWRVALLALAVAATWLDYRTLLGQQAGVALVALLLALKTLELRARRDAFVVFFLGFFALLTLFFHSQSLPTALGILLALLGLLTALVNANLPLGRPPLLLSARLAGRMMLLGTPLMLVLFLLFPRLAPLWGLPADALGGRSGLSDRMQVGQVAQLALDPSVALRIRFDGQPPTQDALYFRGPVLSRFDGIEWRPAPTLPDAARAALRVAGEPVRYQVTLEPSRRPWLFVLEATPQAPLVPGHRPYMSADLQWLTRQPLTELVRYEAQSYTSFRHGPERANGALQEQVELPAGYNPRTLALARQLRSELERSLPAGQDPGAALIERGLDRLRRGGYRYTLEPGGYGRDSADEFWFDRRAGFCEHIAASFVILLRAAGVPARVVTGYQGGERNPVDGLWSVRQSDAHAWAEVWLPGQGWTRVDPTAAVQPDRIGTLQRLRPAPGLLADAMIRVSPTLVAQWGQAWEALNHRWNQWVLDYSQTRQLDLLRRLGFAAPDSADLVRLLAGLLGLLGLAGAAWALRQGHRRDPWLRLLQRARQRLLRAGYPVAPQATPRQLAGLLEVDAAAAGRWPALRDWLLALERQRYDPSSRHSLAELRRQADKLDWPPPLRATSRPVPPSVLR